jgi:hypothetical protein
MELYLDEETVCVEVIVCHKEERVHIGLRKAFPLNHVGSYFHSEQTRLLGESKLYSIVTHHHFDGR